MSYTFIDPSIFEPSIKPQWAKRIPAQEKVERIKKNLFEWVASSDPDKYEEIIIDRTDIIKREINTDESFNNLLASPEFIKMIKETDQLYESKPEQFISLSNLYRKTKKIK